MHFVRFIVNSCISHAHAWNKLILILFWFDLIRACSVRLRPISHENSGRGVFLFANSYYWQQVRIFVDCLRRIFTKCKTMAGNFWAFVSKTENIYSGHFLRSFTTFVCFLKFCLKQSVWFHAVNVVPLSFCLLLFYEARFPVVYIYPINITKDGELTVIKIFPVQFVPI